MDESAVANLIKEKPALAPLKETLLSLEPGTYCIHRAWGVGCIKEYDADQNKLTIEFEGDKGSHQMDPAFCAGKLEILPADNIIARHRTNPAEIQELIDSKPVEIFSAILGGCPNQKLSAVEVEATLQYLLGPDYKKWLTSSKKKLSKESVVVFPAKKSGDYELLNEPVAVEDETLVNFYKTKNAKKKIELAESLRDKDSLSDEVKDKLQPLLEELSEAIKDSRVLNAGEKLHGVWVRDDLAKIAGMEVSSFETTQENLLKDSFSTAELADEIPSNYLRRFLELIKVANEIEWQKKITDLLKNSSGKFTQECVSFLTDNGEEELLGETLHRWLQEQALKGPILMWIIKNRNSRKYSKMIAPMIEPKFFAAIFYAIEYEAIQNASSKRIPLVEVLADDKELIPEMLATATPEVARDLAHKLLMNQGFENLTKRSLIARFIKQFPDIQKLIASDEEPTADQEGLIVSWESLEKRKAEYQELVTKKIPENKEAIAAARELGDLKENSEYKMARQDQDTLMAIKAQMETELRKAKGTDFTDCPTEQVGIGSIVELKTGSGDTTYTILGAWDGNPDANVVSYKTPLAQGLLTKKAGESIEVGGESYTIVSFTRYADTVAKA